MPWLVEIQWCIAAISSFKHLDWVRNAIDRGELSRLVMTLSWTTDGPLLLLLATSSLHSRILSIENILIVIFGSSEVWVGATADCHHFFGTILTLHLTHEVATDVDIVDLDLCLLPLGAGCGSLFHWVYFRPVATIRSLQVLRSIGHIRSLLVGIRWTTVLTLLAS